MSRTQLNHTEREALWTQAGGRCAHGGSPVTLSAYGAQRADGWAIIQGQDRVACWPCSRLKGKQTSAQWRYMLRTYNAGSCPSPSR